MKPPIPVLAFNGPVGVGKSSLMDFFRRDGYDVMPASISSSLKREVTSALRLPEGYMDEHKNLVRPVLVAWSEFKRGVDQDYWISQLIDSIWAYSDEFSHLQPPPNPYWYIDDVRYLNEVERLRKYGATLIQLQGDVMDSVNYMVSKGLTEDQAWSIANSQGETELKANPDVFDFCIPASRHRPLRSIYEELKYELQYSGVL